jgi:hypothetical protein
MAFLGGNMVESTEGALPSVLSHQSLNENSLLVVKDFNDVLWMTIYSYLS